MTERIDLAGSALRSLDAAWDGPAPKEAYFLTEAQVHATLALVEQQRIANLIALHRHEVKHDIGAWSRLYVEGSEELKPEIKEALGLS